MIFYQQSHIPVSCERGLNVEIINLIQPLAAKDYNNELFIHIRKSRVLRTVNRVALKFVQVDGKSKDNYKDGFEFT